MNWGRAKTILIYMFLFIDILLLYMLFVMHNQETVIKDETIAETVSILYNHNIYIEKENIPTKRYENVALSLNPKEEDIEKVAEKFMVGPVQNEKNGYEKSIFTSDSKKLTIEGLSFSYEVKREKEETDYNKILKNTKNELKKYGFKNTKLSFEPILDETEYNILVRQYSDDIEIKGAELKILADNKGILNMKGILPFEFKKTERKGSIPDTTSILINTIYDENFKDAKIEKIEFIYQINPADITKTEMIAYPAFVIKTAEKEHLFTL